MEGTSSRRLKKGAVPSVFEWNRECQMQPPRLSVWEQQERPPLPESDMEENEMEIDRGHTVGHDYCSVPEPAALDLSLCENEGVEERDRRSTETAGAGQGE